MSGVVFNQLADKTVGVWGTGTEGMAVLAALPVTARPIIVADRKESPPTLAAAAQFGAPLVTPGEVADLGPAVLSSFVLVRSPGISIHRPEIQALRAAGVVVTSLLELWLPHAPARKVIGVTGTKGKSTTTSLISALLEAAGFAVGMAGNMGIPLTSVAACDYAVVEVSSYQAAGIGVSPQIGVLTNLDVDHLPWHGTIDQYRRDKLQLFANPELEYLVVPPWAQAAVTEIAPELSRNPGWSNFPYAIGDGSSLLRNGALVVPLAGTALEPDHLALNLTVACAAVEQTLGAALEPDVIREVVEGFSLPQGRLEVMPTQDGITWVNDPLASNPFAAAAAIRTYRSVPLVVIVGGADRGVDPTPLIEAVRDHGRVRAAVVLGAAGDAWSHLLKQYTSVVPVDDDTLPGAVAAASRLAVAGDAVLFSPSAPTPAEQGNWEDRMRQFAKAVSTGQPG